MEMSMCGAYQILNRHGTLAGLQHVRTEQHLQRDRFARKVSQLVGILQKKHNISIVVDIAHVSRKKKRSGIHTSSLNSSGMSLSSRWEDDSSSLAFVDMISCSLAGGVFFLSLICLYWQRLASSNAHTNRDPPKLMANTQPHFFFSGRRLSLARRIPLLFLSLHQLLPHKHTNTHTRARVHTVGGRRRRRHCVMPLPSPSFLNPTKGCVPHKRFFANFCLTFSPTSRGPFFRTFTRTSSALDGERGKPHFPRIRAQLAGKIRHLLEQACLPCVVSFFPQFCFYCC